MSASIQKLTYGVQAVSKTAAEGILRVDDDLHLTPLKPVREAQLPELILAVDAEVHFNWIMLG